MCFAYRTSLLPSRATVLVQFECAPLLRRLQSRGSVELRTVSGYRVRWRNCGDLAWAMNSASSVTQPLDPPEVMSVLSFDDDSSRTATWAPDGAAVRVFSRVTRARRAGAAIEPARHCLERCSSSSGMPRAGQRVSPA